MFSRRVESMFGGGMERVARRWPSWTFYVHSMLRLPIQTPKSENLSRPVDRAARTVNETWRELRGRWLERLRDGPL